MGCTLFRKQKELKRMRETLKKNYILSDTLKGVSTRRKFIPVTYIRKRNKDLPFGDLVIKVSWIKVDKIGMKAIERNQTTDWEWKLIRYRLTE